MAFGGIWLFVEAGLRYAVRHDARIVNWAGRWPTSDSEQQQINDRLDRAQDRELRRLAVLRPIPVAALLAAAVLIVIGAVR